MRRCSPVSDMVGSILLADDEEKILKTLGRALRDDGHEVVTAANARDATRALSARAFDLLVIDFLMPDRTGLEVIREMAASTPEGERPAIVMMTAHGSIESAVEAMKLGARDYLQKPFEVEELLVLARLDAGQERGPTETVCLNELAQDAARRLDSTARPRQVHINLEPAPPVNAMVARGPASLVLANLLDNALKFSPAGSSVTLRVAAVGLQAVVSVADTGPGLQAEELPHLFDRFYRGSAARASGAPGIGLGLALSQAIVHAHGGSIEASSPASGGATFSIRLPLAGDRPSSQTAHAS